MLLVEMRKIDQQRRLTQELNQHAQQQAAKLLVRGLAHEIKTHSAVYAAQHNYWKNAARPFLDGIHTSSLNKPTD